MSLIGVRGSDYIGSLMTLHHCGRRQLACTGAEIINQEIPDQPKLDAADEKVREAVDPACQRRKKQVA
ncbi:hypothetical protein ABZ619_31705 [Streptomyces sp. NPDC007851]|uniref:hypothetical protein n=1 Tax=Streptomyces sp. NPDC007851 TaxID=3155008 RepID=UPI0033FB4936